MGAPKCKKTLTVSSQFTFFQNVCVLNHVPKPVLAFKGRKNITWLMVAQQLLIDSSVCVPTLTLVTSSRQ